MADEDPNRPQGKIRFQAGFAPGRRFESSMSARHMDDLLGSSTGTGELIGRFQAGETQALERLWIRYLPRLRRWAHGRLPSIGRNASDTDDLVQDTFVRSLAHLRTLKPRGPESLISYFKTIILNQIRDYLRQSLRRPVRPLGETDEEVHAGSDPSPLQQLLGQELLERYQTALLSLSNSDQDIVLAAVELRLSDAEIAELFEKPSISAARMARGRALARLGRAMEIGMSRDRDRA